MNANVPVAVHLHRRSGELELAYADGRRYRMSAEFLRVHSPSAEVRGHGPRQETLQVGKRNVRIADCSAVGNYALGLRFDDGHDTGLYSWNYLAELGAEQARLWQRYLDKLAAAGASREPLPAGVRPLTIRPAPTLREAHDG